MNLDGFGIGARVAQRFQNRAFYRNIDTEVHQINEEQEEDAHQFFAWRVPDVFFRHS